MGRIGGGTVSPMRGASAAAPSTRQTRRSGANCASEIAAAQPAGPAPAIRTSTSVGASCKHLVLAHGVERGDDAGGRDRAGAAARVRNGADHRADDGRALL